MATAEQLENALRKADAAGNADDARKIAQALRQMRDAPKADFSTVESEPAETVAPEADNAPETMGGQLAADTRSFVSGAANLVDAATAPVRVGLNKLDILPQQQGVAGLVDTVANKLGVPQNKPSIRTSAIEGVGGTLPTLGAGAAAKGAQGVAGAVGKVLAARPGIQALSGATGAASSEAAREAGAGAVGQTLAGLAGGLAPSARLGGRMAPTAALQDAVEEGAARGIPVRPIAAGGKATEVLRNLPLTGAAKRYDQDVAAINKAVAKTIGVPDAPIVTPKVYAAKKAEDAKVLNELMERNELKVDQGLIGRLAAIENESAVAGKDAQSAVKAAIEKLTAQTAVGKDGITVPGKAYQALDTQLGRVPKTSPAYAYITDLKEAIRGQMDKSISKADSARWSKWRQEYGDRKAISKLVADAQGKPLKPEDLMGKVNVKGYNGTERMASGTRGELGTLAKLGQNIIAPHTNKAILPIGTIAAAGTGALVPSSAPAIFTLAALSNLAGRAADKPFLTRALAALRQDKKSAAAAGAASGTGSQQRKKKED